MGEFEVHRVRFFGLVPAGVRCLACHPRGTRLALARTDGAVEVYNFSANYFQEKVIPGHEARSVESLCWAAGDRLFGAGLGGDITEYDLSGLSAARGLDGGGGPIWSMVANSTGTQLAIGCEDGSVKIFQVVPGGIQFERNLDRRKGRVLCLSWHPSDTHIVAGSIDFFRVINVTSGQTVQRIMVNHRVEKAKRECVVWAIALLSSGTVVSADSFGRVQFWDWEQGTLAESHTVSTSAVLSLAVSQKEDSMIVGTSTGATYHLQLLPVRLGGLEKRWVRTKPFQFHSHDVRAVAHSPTALISGGLDAQLVIRPLMEKVQKKSYDAALRKFTFPHRRLVSCARKARLLLFQFSQYLELWRLGSTEETGKDGEVLPLCRMPEHLVQLKSKGPEHIYCSCVSPCGTWLGYSTASRFQLYRVRCDGDGVSLRKVPKVPKLLPPAYQLQFSADSESLFVASARGSVHVLQLLEPGGCKHLHTLRPPSGCSEAVYLLAPSADGHWLAAVTGDWAIHIYNLKCFKHHCVVPNYDCAVSALAIHPSTNNLVIAYSDQQLFEFSIPEKQYTSWSRAVQSRGLHRAWLERDSPITHITFNPKNPSHILLHDTYLLCVLDKSLPLPDDSALLMNQSTLKQLPETARKRQLHAFKICKKFQPLLFMDLLDKNCLVVVERPIMDFKTQLPLPVQQKKFGT
ncbi:U3 small nucleolar RNA-associated protein 4 homolog isoform X2 [Camarhynchus parvulus]|uniref:UTP4 small subunit processome component n=1 Tax=Geospiza parvula TaxID=87175 RepID=A0A8C3MPY6_GEOPR|nr:U3 small nucleolar RNA-associated protein 4 homolog isoform X2 [Camarhynchus parvulus]